MQNTEFYKRWAEILAHTWVDQSYRDRVEADPTGVLTEYGIAIPPNVQITVKPIDETPTNTTVLVLPFPPAPSDLRASEALPLNAESAERTLAEGSCCCSSAICCCCP